MDFSRHLRNSDPANSTAFVVVTTVIATLTFLALARYVLHPNRPKVIPNPLKTLIPHLSQEQLKKLEYQPDHFPGARDVATPYGSMRVYEWGPETGPKVLLIHGISTSCMTLSGLAHRLAARGCRVMLYDLFGRGFSDGVGDVPHDARLYVSQALLALASSPLAWTGAGAFRLAGYSLGGGVAVHLAAALPAGTVRGLLLLAPAGMIRAANFGAASRLLFSSGLVPERLLALATRRRLRRPIAAGTARARAAAAALTAGRASKALDLAATEAGGAEVGAEAEAGAAADGLEDRVLKYVHWMLEHHDGFVPAFMSCIRFAPLTEQAGAFALLARRPAMSTCFILARHDEIIDLDDYTADVLPLVGGRERVEWAVVGGGHDFPMTHVDEVMAVVDRAWGLK